MNALSSARRGADIRVQVGIQSAQFLHGSIHRGGVPVIGQRPGGLACASEGQSDLRPAWCRMTSPIHDSKSSSITVR